MTEPHAEVMRRAAIELGVKPDRIKAFPLAKDTEEEAKSMKPYLDGKQAAPGYRSVTPETCVYLLRKSRHQHHSCARPVLRLRKK